VSDVNAESRRDVLLLARRTLDIIGRLYKVVPTALVAAAVRPSMARRDLPATLGPLVDTIAAHGGNLETTDVGDIAEAGVARLEARGVLVLERGVLRIRDRHGLRYYARTIEHLLVPAPRAARTH
jgi:hypothetical protein